MKCGGWNTATDTEEVQPDFNISRGEHNSQFVAADIATIHVSDDNFEAQSATHNIYPACLPSSNTNLNRTAVHSGWSKPPTLDYTTNNAHHYEEFYGEFFKQWHYLMNFTKCKDPKTLLPSGSTYTLNYPTNHTTRLV